MLRHYRMEDHSRWRRKSGDFLAKQGRPRAASTIIHCPGTPRQALGANTSYGRIVPLRLNSTTVVPSCRVCSDSILAEWLHFRSPVAANPGTHVVCQDAMVGYDDLVLLVVTSLAGPVTELFTPGMITEEARTKKARPEGLAIWSNAP